VGVYQNGSHIMFFEDGMLVHDIDENADFEDLLCRATLANTRPNYHKSWQVVNEAKNSTCPGLDVKRVFTKDGQAKDYRGDDIEGEPYTFITPSPGYAYSYLSGKIGFRHQNGITLYDDLRVWSLKPPRYGPEKSAIIIDNTDSGASFSTGWNVSTRDPHMGENYRYARVGAKETVTWTPEIEVAGMYTVYVRWPASKPDDRASNAPYTVAYADGKTKTITMNQKQIALANDWQILGTFPFEEGTSGSISLTNETDDSVAADAVKFVYYGRAPGAE